MRTSLVGWPFPAGGANTHAVVCWPETLAGMYVTQHLPSMRVGRGDYAPPCYGQALNLTPYRSLL